METYGPPRDSRRTPNISMGGPSRLSGPLVGPLIAANGSQFPDSPLPSSRGLNSNPQFDRTPIGTSLK